MKKILAFILTLAMVLSLFSVGFVVSAEMVTEGTEIKDAAGLASMSEGGTYYLSADIYVGTSQIYEEGDDGLSFTKSVADDDAGTITITANAIEQSAVEAGIITIPAGVTLYGNGYTIYQNYYVENPVDYVNSKNVQGAGTHSLAWKHAMFQLAEGDMITLNNVNFGSEDYPINLTKDTNTVGIFANATAGVQCTWNKVNFYLNRADGGLSGYNCGPIMHSAGGTLVFNNCVNNNLYVSAGNQHGGWFYDIGVANTQLSMTDCINNGICLGTVQSGYIHNVPANMTSTLKFTNCVNNVNLTSTHKETKDGVSTGRADSFASGGFVGYTYSGNTLKFYNCVNNGDIKTTTTIAGGIIARSNGSLTELVVDNCVNNGDVTFTGTSAQTSNYGLGGLIGHAAATTFTVTNSKNTGAVSGTGNVGGIVGRFDTGTTKTFENNVNSGAVSAVSVGAASVGGVMGQLNTALTISACANYGDVSGTSTQGSGGILSGVWGTGDIPTFVNCKNFGAVNSSTYAAGIFALANGDSAVISNCANYGAIGSTAIKHAAGMIAYVGAAAKISLTGSANYGSITTKQYSGGMIAEINAAATVEIDSCANYGEIAGVHAVAGFVAQTANNESLSIDITNSLNAGYIHEGSVAGEGIGGFFGRIVGAKTKITLTKCANIGNVTGSTKAAAKYGAFGDTFGQFIGAYTVNAARNYTGTDVDDAALVGGFLDWSAEGVNKPVLTDCYAYGTATPAIGAKSLKGWNTAHYVDGVLTALTQDTYTLTEIAVTAAPNNGVYGINVEIDADSTVDITADVDKLEDLATALGIDFMAGGEGENAIVVATPEIRGYQTGVANKNNVRFVATINSLNYSGVGFEYSVSYDANKDGEVDNTLEGSKWVEYVYASVNAAGDTVAAADFGAEYIAVISFENVPTAGTVVITINAVCEGTNGTSTYNGDSYVMTITDGEVVSCVKA